MSVLTIEHWTLLLPEFLFIADFEWKCIKRERVQLRHQIWYQPGAANIPYLLTNLTWSLGVLDNVERMWADWAACKNIYLSLITACLLAGSAQVVHLPSSHLWRWTDNFWNENHYDWPQSFQNKSLRVPQRFSYLELHSGTSSGSILLGKSSLNGRSALIGLIVQKQYVRYTWRWLIMEICWNKQLRKLKYTKKLEDQTRIIWFENDLVRYAMNASLSTW